MDVKILIAVVLAIFLVWLLLRQPAPVEEHVHNENCNHGNSKIAVTPLDLEEIPEPEQEQFRRGGEPVPVVLFHGTWCGYCTQFMPTWDAVAPRMRNIKAIKIESKDPDMAYHDVKSFPTIRAFPNGLDQPGVDYTGDRSAGDLEQFLASF